MILNNEKKIIMFEKHMHLIINHLKKFIHRQEMLMLVSATQNQTKEKGFLNELRRNVINSQDLNNVKNLRATWINKNTENMNISKKKMNQ